MLASIGINPGGFISIWPKTFFFLKQIFLFCRQNLGPLHKEAKNPDQGSVLEK